MIELYSYYRSPSSYRVRIALALKGIKHKYHGVHLVRNGGEQHAAEFRALNPQCLVPVLADGNTVITQSLAIVEYLDEKHPDPPLLPKRPADRAFARQIAQICASDMQPLATLRVLNHLTGECGASQAQRAQWHVKWLKSGFDAIETLLSQSPLHAGAGPYCCGRDVTLADICLIPQVYDARRQDMDVSAWPLIEAVEKNCLALDAFQAAAPENQPDTPEDQRPAFIKNRTIQGQ